MFSEGDKVFVANYGWGLVIKSSKSNSTIRFNSRLKKTIPNFWVSTCEYEVCGINQINGNNISEDYGKKGRFFNDFGDVSYIGTLEYFNPNSEYAFFALELQKPFMHFRLLTDDYI